MASQLRSSTQTSVKQEHVTSRDTVPRKKKSAHSRSLGVSELRQNSMKGQSPHKSFIPLFFRQGFHELYTMQWRKSVLRSGGGGGGGMIAIWR